METPFLETSLGSKLSTDHSFAYEILICVFSYLTPVDLLRASRVCTLWNWIITDRGLWSSKVVRACGKHMETVLEEFGERATKVGLYSLVSYAMEYDPVAEVESQLRILKKYPNIRVLILQECDKRLIENLDKANKNIKEIYAGEVLDNCNFTITNFSLDFVKNIPNLKVLAIGSWFGNISLNSLSCLKESKIENLKTHSSRIIDWKGLSEIQSLKTLVLEGSVEDIKCSELELVTALKKLKNLSTLHFEMYASISHFDDFSHYSSTLLGLVKDLPNLTELHIQFYYNYNDQGDPDNFIRALSSCSSIKILYISFGPGEGSGGEHLYEIANSTTLFLKALSTLKQLSKFTYTFSRMHFKVIRKYAKDDQAFTAILKPNIPLNTWRMSASKMIDVVNRQTFENMLKNALPKTQIIIVVSPKRPSNNNVCFLCAESNENESVKSSEPESDRFGRESDSEIDYSDDSNGDLDLESEYEIEEYDDETQDDTSSESEHDMEYEDEEEL